MPQLSVALETEKRKPVVPGEFGVVAVVTNESDETAYLNVGQAGHAALVLEVRDTQGETVLLRPPDAPREEQAGRGEAIKPGATMTIEYVGFLDRSQPAGKYEIRYAGRYEPLGGDLEDPLLSDWLRFEIAEPEEPFEIAEPLPARLAFVKPTGFLAWWKKWWHRIVCFIRRFFGGAKCDQVITRDVDEARTEVMSDAPPGFEAWNGTYGWKARFRLVVDQGDCRATATIRVRLVGTITAAQRNAWENAIEAAWSNVFRACCVCCCCASGYVVVGNIEFVESGEDQVVNVGSSTTNMGNWGRNDTTAVSHEFGHMLGALDEYYTVDGTAWGMPNQNGAGIMNNPSEPPLARHYGLVEQAIEAALGTSCSVSASC